MPSDIRLLNTIRNVLSHIDGDVTLQTVAAESARSPTRLHRTFHRVMGETLKQYTLRLRVERAAAALVTTRDSIIDVALAAGFASHEVFTRAFTRRFGRTPLCYRKHALRNVSMLTRLRHRELVEHIGPCLGLFHFSIIPPRRACMPILSIERRVVAAMPVLFIRRRIAANELQATLAECFGKLYGYAQTHGFALAGFPLARYITTGPGLWTIEPCVPLVTTVSGAGEIEAGMLPAGAVAFAVHGGPYEELHGTNAEIERWIEKNDYRIGGAPWEWYVTDPGEHPDPANWRTEVYWPLAE